jgi:hypothetical protein
MDKVTKYFIGKVRSVDSKNFTAEVVISDETKDRYDERVLVQSFKKTKKEFMKHPVLLSSHAYRGLMNQIGMFESLKIDDTAKEVVAKAKWFVGEGNPEADWGWKLAEHGIAAFSIGFIPKKTIRYDEETREKNGGIWCDYEEIELLETSQVLIPANPSALQKSFGDVDKDDLFLMKLSEKIYDTFKNLDAEDDKGVVWEEKKKDEGEEDTTSSEEQENTNENEEAQKALEIENKKWEETDGEIRHRVREPENFEKFRTIKIKKDKPRVNAIYGKVKGKEERQIQALRFLKEDEWTMESAKSWVKEHPDTVKFLEDISFEEEDNDVLKTMEEYRKSFDSMLKEVCGTLVKNIVSSLSDPELKDKLLGELKVTETSDTETETPAVKIVVPDDAIGEEKMTELRGILLPAADTTEGVDKVREAFASMTEEVSRIFSVQR